MPTMGRTNPCNEKLQIERNRIMNASKIEKGKQYEITIGKNKTTVKVLSVDTRVNGQTAFDCMNTKTNKRLTVTDPKRFLREIKDEKSNPIGKAAKKIIDALGIGPGSGKPKEEATVPETKKERGKGGKPAGKMSGLDAAHEILKEQNREMNVKEITELAISSGKWSPNGKTP
ncbi:MAG TPA: hypothetical protein DEB39_03655 [Planctomycetaceae bacterium]|nr:hypothetical protein [Planctomycetaceae bacterium]